MAVRMCYDPGWLTEPAKYFRWMRAKVTARRLAWGSPQTPRYFDQKRGPRMIAESEDELSGMIRVFLADFVQGGGTRGVVCGRSKGIVDAG